MRYPFSILLILHHGVFGPNDKIKRPKEETKLDLELEMGVVIGKKGKDIKAEEADDYIFGYTIFNDWTARAIQKQEMTVPLGPHKGKDFANAFGPCIVTKDELKNTDVAFHAKLTLSIYKCPKAPGIV